MIRIDLRRDDKGPPRARARQSDKSQREGVASACLGVGARAAVGGRINGIVERDVFGRRRCVLSEER